MRQQRRDEFDDMFNRNMQQVQRTIRLATIRAPIWALVLFGLCGFGVWAVYQLVMWVVAQ